MLKGTPDKFDVIIIGGGAAGMSAALWCADLGLGPLLIEQNRALGGQMLWTHNPITNYLGLDAENGAELAGKFVEHVMSAGIEILAGREVTSVDVRSRRVVVEGYELIAKAIVIATGVRRRKLGVPGEEEFSGRGILGSGARDREGVRDKQVVIVGGGDAALENAVILSEAARKVYVIHRRESFSARDEFVSKVRRRSNVEFVLGSVVTAIGGLDRLQYVTVVDTLGQTSRIDCEAMLIRVGVEPNAQLFTRQIELDDKGYIVVDKELRTSVDSVWAIGDITHPAAMTVANAVGAGSVAAKSISADR